MFNNNTLFNNYNPMRIKYIIPYFTAILLLIGFSAYKKAEAVPELVWYTDLNQVHQI